MSRRHWGIGLALVALIAADSAAYGQDEPSGADNPTQQQATVANPEAPPLTTGEAITEAAIKIESALRDPVTENGQTQSERDLQAQEDMALWAMVMAILTGVTAAVAVYVAIIVRRTLTATAKAAVHTEIMANEAREVTIATTIAANAASKTNDLMREASERQDRAYLLAAPMGIKSLVGSHDCIGHVQLKNVGSTPAYNVSLKVKTNISEDKEWNDFNYPPDPVKVERAIQPGGDMLQGSMKPFVPIGSVDRKGTYVYVWGIAYYDDIFGRRHFTKFCHRYNTIDRRAGNVAAIKSPIKGPTEAKSVIGAEKARHHTRGNDAD